SSNFIATLATRSMPQAMIAAPPAARRLAVARPIPVVPVTRATLPSKSFIAETPSFVRKPADVIGRASADVAGRGQLPIYGALLQGRKVAGGLAGSYSGRRQ